MLKRLHRVDFRAITGSIRGKEERRVMIKVKTFAAQMKIFHTRQELEHLDKAVCDFIASAGIRKVISVSDAATTGEKGETIGLVRVLTYEEPEAGSREKYQEKIESALQKWGGEIEKLREKADRLGAEARGRLREQIEELRERQKTAGRKLEELKGAGSGAWEDLREGAENAIEELKKGVEKVIARLK
jgi:hypothetical protein